MKRSVVVLLASAAALAAAAPPSQAVHHHHDEALPNVDRRTAERATVPSATRAARRELSRRLGVGATVRTDAVGGGVAYVGRPGGLLTGPSGRTPREIVLEWVRDRRDVFGLSDADIANLRLVARSVSPDGITHLRFNQVLDGIWSFDSGIDGHVTADGRLVNVSGAPVPGASLREKAPRLSATGGLRAARAAVGGEAATPAVAERASGPGRETTFTGGERAVLRWSATADGPRLAWSVIADDGDDHVYDVLVDAGSGELLRRQSITHQLGQARWFRADPEATPVQSQITMPPAWYDDHAGGTRLWGQYARTYVDPADEDPEPGSEQGGTRRQIPASGGAPGQPDWLYEPGVVPGPAPCPLSGCPWDAGDLDSATQNERQAAVNVHVLTSRFHDHLERAPIGFDEASGNFQRTNASGRGLGGDYVRTEVNDGYLKTAGTPPAPAPTFNNANFFTPPDGQAPRMQMFLWRPPYRHVNGSDIAEIVYHEYGHGLSNRLVVNASGASALSGFQSRMMGEAWSDFYALDLLVHEGDLTDAPGPNLVIAEYVADGTGGIRAKPIDCPVAPAGLAGCDGHFGTGTVLGGYTYGDLANVNVTNGSPHNGGEVWGETLWEIRTAVGRETALALITGGMRLSPDAPSMLDMRDAILQQAVAMRSAPGAADDHYAELWAIFAGRGMGIDASTPNADALATEESYALPSGVKLLGDPAVSDPYPGGDNDGRVEPGERIELSQRVWGVGLLDLAGVTGTVTGVDPALAILDGSAAWPLLGRGRIAANDDPLAVRIESGACLRPVPVSVAISSSEGGTSATAKLDPRPFSDAVTPLADGTSAPGGGADLPGVTTASFTVRGSGAVTDVDVRIDELRHSWLGDLRVELIHDGRTAVLLDRPGGASYGGDDVIDAVIDSDVDVAVATPAAGPITGRFRPPVRAALDAFDGTPVAGLWTLRISDHAPDDAGTLRRWGIDAPGQACGRVEIPAAQTGGAAEVGTSEATVDGSVTPNGRATGLRFAYGTTSAYGQTTAVEQVGDGDDAVARSAALTGLAADTTYHYRVEAIRENGQVAVAGEDRIFTTPPAPQGPPPGDRGGDGGERGGDGGGGDRTGPGGAAHDRRGPQLSRARVTLAKVAKRKDRRRATVAFAIDEPARVTVAVTRRAPGLRLGRRCVAVPRRRPRGAKRCTRVLKVSTVSAPIAKAGAAKVRLPATGLRRGRYVARLTARDAAGNRSPRTLVVRFVVR